MSVPTSVECTPLSRHLELPVESWTDTIRGAFREKVVEVNLKAFEAGRQLGTEGR